MAELDIPAEMNRWSSDHALLSTYEFDPQFFERYCLEKLNAFKTNNNVSVLVDAGTYGKLVAAPPEERPQRANVRYLFHPIRVGRTFHPKVYLFASAKRGLLIVGSANLTRPGITRNAELVQAFRYEVGKKEDYGSLFSEVFSFFQRLHDRNPNEHLASNLDAMTCDCPWLASEYPTRSSHRFLHNLDGPLLDQLAEGLGAPSRHVLIVSPFFDSTARLLQKINSALKPSRVEIYTQNGTTTLSPEWIESQTETDTDCAIHLAEYGHPKRQRLHGKGIAIAHSEGVRLAIGSANFTGAALASAAKEGNLEALVCTDLPSAGVESVRDIFNPLGASVLATTQNLKCREFGDDEEEPTAPGEMTLIEVAVSGQRLTCRVQPENPRATFERLVLSFQDTAQVELRLSRAEHQIIAHAGDDFARLSEGGACIARVRYSIDGRSTLTNAVFLTNLRDIRSGKGQRRERHIREAQHSAVQVLAVLNDLLRSDMAGALQTFLTHCDIQGEYGRRPTALEHHSPPVLRHTLRRLDERNLRRFFALDDAAVSFVERHIARLQRHVKTPKVAGLVNFLHIATATSRVIEAQVSRGIFALTQLDGPVSNYDWGHFRQKINRYYTHFATVMNLAAQQYLPKLRRRYRRGEFADLAAPEIHALREVSQTLISARDELEAVRGSSLLVAVDGARNVPPPYFTGDVYAAPRWEKMVVDLAKSQTLLGN